VVDDVGVHGRVGRKFAEARRVQSITLDLSVVTDERRTAEGLTKREIMSVLKRYVARETYRLLPLA
jgi:hypothetical protein